jgi:Ni/Co efflux regulator RcnB
MQKLFTTAALVALVATPVLAQTKDRPAQPSRAQASQTVTTQERQQQEQRRSVSRSQDVYDIRGHYVGSDPDPTVRAQMGNDPNQAD